MAKRPRNWVDSRLIIGIVLVIGSVLGVVGVVQHLAQTTTVYVTRVDVATGDRITAEQLTAMEVSVSAPTELYLTQLAQEGYVASRPIGAGELVPLAALGSADTSSAVVMVAISGEIPGGISPGTQVALWGANPGEQPGTYEKPQVIVAAAQVTRIIKSDAFVATSQTNVELRVPDEKTAAVMEATFNGALLQLVPSYEQVRG